MSAERRLEELGLDLPSVRPPAASYVNAVRTGNLVYLSGAGPVTAAGQVPTGKVGDDVTTEEAAAHARVVASISSRCSGTRSAVSTASTAS